jgi:hypothetical protein
MTETQTVNIHTTGRKNLHISNLYIPPRNTTEANHRTEDVDVENYSTT